MEGSHGIISWSIGEYSAAVMEVLEDSTRWQGCENLSFFRHLLEHKCWKSWSSKHDFLIYNTKDIQGGQTKLKVFALLFHKSLSILV